MPKEVCDSFHQMLIRRHRDEDAIYFVHSNQTRRLCDGYCIRDWLLPPCVCCCCCPVVFARPFAPPAFPGTVIRSVLFSQNYLRLRMCSAVGGWRGRDERRFMTKLRRFEWLFQLLGADICVNVGEKLTRWYFCRHIHAFLLVNNALRSSKMRFFAVRKLSCLSR